MKAELDARKQAPGRGFNVEFRVYRPAYLIDKRVLLGATQLRSFALKRHTVAMPKRG